MYLSKMINFVVAIQRMVTVWLNQVNGKQQKKIWNRDGDYYCYCQNDECYYYIRKYKFN